MPTLAVLMLIVALSGCQRATEPAAAGGPARAASAELRDASGQKVGQASLSEVAGGVRIVIDVAGLPPGPKGFHVHEIARCDPPTFESAAGHFNPTGKEHGAANPRGPHAGDLPNIAVDASGRAHLDITTERLTLGLGPTSVFDRDGSAIVVHAEPDDLKTDPTGQSGNRLACGVVVRGTEG